MDRGYHVWGMGMAIVHLYMSMRYFQGDTDPRVRDPSLYSRSSGLWSHLDRF